MLGWIYRRDFVAQPNASATARSATNDTSRSGLSRPHKTTFSEAMALGGSVNAFVVRHLVTEGELELFDTNARMLGRSGWKGPSV